MASLENWEGLKAQANENRRRERERFDARLEAGEEVDLLETVAVLRILPSESWRLGAFSGRGRYGGLLQPHVTIPDFAWAYVRWQMDGVRCALVTPEGEKIYDVWLRTSDPAKSVAEEDEVYEDTSFLAPAEPVGPAKVELSVVMQRIVETRPPHGLQWTLDEYKTEFAKAGIAVVRGKHDRVSGVTIGDDGRIESAGGSIYLTNALMVTRFRLARSDGFLSDCRRGRDVARKLYGWLAVEHPNILGVVPEASKDLKAIDALVDILRGCFGNFLEQVAGTRPEH